jgi:putative tryptophan/tyrosine transport system substrate-binding protein
MARKQPDGVVVAAGVLLSARRQVTERLASLRVPAIYLVTEFVSDGGLMSYSAELADNLRRAAGYVDRTLKGAKPADLPVEQPRSFELVVNLKAAREQGIKIPQSLLIRATRVIE